MELRSVEELLKKYYDGDTSLEEERQLKMFFNGTDVPVELLKEQMQFSFFVVAAKETTGADFDKTFFAVATEHKRLSIRPQMRVSRMAAGIAACIFIAIGMYMTHTGNAGKTAIDARSLLAYEQAKHTLLSISVHLNKGSEKLTRISKLNEIEQHITSKK